MKTLLISPKEHTVVHVTEDTQYLLDLHHVSGDVLNVEFLMEVSGVTAEVFGFYSLKENQKLVLTTVSRHLAPHTSCMTRIKGVLDGAASSAYIGKILISKEAQQTSSFLSHNVLVVGSKTSNSSQPILEIDADDVKASHGATTGRISEDQLYYLATRGLDAVTSRNLIIQGFFESDMQNIKDTALADKLAADLFIKGIE